MANTTTVKASFGYHRIQNPSSLWSQLRDLNYQVALGRCRPRAPTDPDVPVSGIRFVKSRFRCVR